MKEPVSYRDQITRAKQEVGSWTQERKSWMQAQGTNEYLEKRLLNAPQRASQVVTAQKKK
jgi:hypothetical protein